MRPDFASHSCLETSLIKRLKWSLTNSSTILNINSNQTNSNRKPGSSGSGNSLMMYPMKRLSLNTHTDISVSTIQRSSNNKERGGEFNHYQLNKKTFLLSLLLFCKPKLWPLKRTEGRGSRCPQADLASLSAYKQSPRSNTHWERRKDRD